MGADFMTGGFAPCSTCHGLQHELASYRAIVQSAAEERRELEHRLDGAYLANDRLARELANASDLRDTRLAATRLRIMQRVAPFLARQTFGHGPERDAFQELFAHLAESGVVAPEIEEMRRVWEERENNRE